MRYLFILFCFSSFTPLSSDYEAITHEIEHLKIEVLIKKQNGQLDINKIKDFINDREC